MTTSEAVSIAVLAAVLVLSGCAVSPEDEARRQAMEQDIADILSAPLDPAEYGETKRCLSDLEYRSFRALDDRRLLFIGRRGRLYLNTLRTRCSDLRHATALRIKSFSARRMCDADTFYAGEWFDWPWYRRSPLNWGSSWGSTMPCKLGVFQPVTEEQVAEIEAALRRRN